MNLQAFLNNSHLNTKFRKKYITFPEKDNLQKHLIKFKIIIIYLIYFKFYNKVLNDSDKINFSFIDHLI